MKVIQETTEAFSDFIHIMAIDRNIGHQKANNECKSTFRPLKAQGALIDEWIKEINGIGFLEHHANIIGQAVVRRNPNTQYFNCYEFGSVLVLWISLVSFSLKFVKKHIFLPSGLAAVGG